MNRVAWVCMVVLSVCSQQVQAKQVKQQCYQSQLGSVMAPSAAVFLLSQCSREAPSDNYLIDGLWVPDGSVINKLERRLRNYLLNLSFDNISPLNVTARKKLKIVTRFKSREYFFQYIGYLSGEKFIYINAIILDGVAPPSTNYVDHYMNCSTKPELAKRLEDWRVSPITVCDGEESAWGAIYDVGADAIFDLQVN